MNNLHVKTGDNVMVISGKDKGKTGKVLQTSPKEGKVIVEGLNMVTKHVKPRRQGGRYLRLQGHARLPQVWQGHPRGPFCQGRQDRPRLPQVRR